MLKGENPIPQLNCVDMDANPGCFRLRMGEEQRADFEPLVEQFLVTKIGQHMMQSPKSSLIKVVGPMLRLMRGPGGVADLITDVEANSQTCFIGKNKILTGYR